MATELSSTVNVFENPPAVRRITGAASAVFGMIGLAERGPIGEAVLLTSFADYTKQFGGYIADDQAYLAQAVKSFFAESRGQLWAVRTAHYGDVTDPDTLTAVRASEALVTPGAATVAEQIGGAAPFSIEDGATIVLDPNGTGDVTATFNGAAGVVLSSGSAPFSLADAETLIIAIDGGAQQTITLATADFGDISNASLLEVMAAINKELVGGAAVFEGVSGFKIVSDTKGTDSSVEIVGGTARADMGLAVETGNGTGNVADLAAVTVSEIETIVEDASALVAVDTDDSGNLRISTVLTGAAATLEISASTADAFGFTEGVEDTGADSSSTDAFTIEGKTHGTYADTISIVVEEATSGEADRFNLRVVDDGTTQETYVNLSSDPTDARYIVDILAAQSNLIRATDLEVVGSPRPDDQTITLSGGDDGLTDLADVDFLGAASEDGKTGLRAFDLVREVSVLAMPGQASSALHNGLISYCENEKEGQVFAVLDTPSALARLEAITYVETTAALIGSTEQAAVYWPWVKIANPSAAVFGSDDSIVVPPSGSVCGVFARTEQARLGGIYDAPAGPTRGILRGIVGVEDEAVLEKATRDLIYPKRINPITRMTGKPWTIDGARGLDADGNFPNVSERRGVNFIKRSLEDGLAYVRFEPHDESLRASVIRTSRGFLNTQMQRGAFRSVDPETAYQVVCDDTNNSAQDVFDQRINIDILLATAKPAEFVNISISQDTSAL